MGKAYRTVKIRHKFGKNLVKDIQFSLQYEKGFAIIKGMTHFCRCALSVPLKNGGSRK